MTKLKLIRILERLTHQGLSERIDKMGLIPVGRNNLSTMERTIEDMERRGGWKPSQDELKSVSIALQCPEEHLFDEVSRNDLLVTKGQGNL